tara:strand:+ start:298 stop:687 length:390 start_codon:yes stop_codon:yes gene_type:complete
MAKRQSVNFPGFSHANPIPNASRIGNIMMSSVISGRDPDGSGLPEDLAGQIVNIFKHVRSAVETAGGTPDDILRITFYVKDPAVGRPALNEEWVKMFPDENSRPARHTLTLAGSGPNLVTCEFTAVFQD